MLRTYYTMFVSTFEVSEKNCNSRLLKLIIELGINKNWDFNLFYSIYFLTCSKRYLCSTDMKHSYIKIGRAYVNELMATLTLKHWNILYYHWLLQVFVSDFLSRLKFNFMYKEVLFSTFQLMFVLWYCFQCQSFKPDLCCRAITLSNLHYFITCN